MRPLCRHLRHEPPVGLSSVVLVSDPSQGLDLAHEIGSVDAMRPVHLASGAARSGRLLASGSVRTLVVTPEGALGLSARSILRLSETRRLVVCWPEDHDAAGQLDSLELVLAEAPRAERVVTTGDFAGAADFLSRHAYRAPAVVAAAIPEEGVPGVRYAVVDEGRLLLAVRSLLDTLNPASALIWDPGAGAKERWLPLSDDPGISLLPGEGEGVSRERADLAIAVRLPSGGLLRRLSEAAREVVVLVRAAQLGYLVRITKEARVVRLPSDADAARGRAFAARERMRTELERGEPFGELLSLAPLLDEYDPALVAAAALRALRREGSMGELSTDDIPLWAVIRLDLGKRDRIRPSDVVGCLMNAVGVPKDCVGRVDVRESFSLVSVRAEWAERALLGLNGSNLRGRKVAARVDRR